MAKLYTITKAFQSTNRDTKEPEVVTTGGGDMHKWLFQVEGQEKPGWMQLLKKPGNELKPGDEVYGIVDEWPDGKAKFVKQDRPQGLQSSKPAASSSQPSGDLEDKIDYLISLVEGFLESQGHSTAGAQKSGTENTAADEGLDLSEYDI